MNKPTPAPRQAAHTPEPWRVAGRFITSNGPTVADCACSSILPFDCEEQRANAERIVSCVNPLEGVSNPAAVKQLIEAVKLAELYLLNGVTYQGERQEVEQALQTALAALESPVAKDLGSETTPAQEVTTRGD